jgi:hypothetical protein
VRIDVILTSRTSFSKPFLEKIIIPIDGPLVYKEHVKYHIHGKLIFPLLHVHGASSLLKVRIGVKN